MARIPSSPDVGPATTRDGRDLSPEAVIELLRAMEARTGRALLAEEVAHQETALYYAALRYWDTFDRVREVAGLAHRPGPLVWTPERVIEELRALYERGVRIRTPELRALRNGILGGIVRMGGLERARELAGIPEQPKIQRYTPKYSWTADKVVQKLRARHRARESLAPTRVPTDLSRAATFYFGDYRSAVEAAGFCYADVCDHRALGDDELLERLRVFAREHPHATKRDIATKGKASTLVVRFGSVEEAVRRAGLEGWPTPRSFPVYDRDETVTRLRQRAREGGRLAVPAMAREDSRLLHSCRRHFPTLRAALAAAGIEDHDLTPHKSADWVIATLRELMAQGKQPTSATSERLRYWAKRHFGSWSKAMAAATASASRSERG